MTKQIRRTSEGHYQQILKTWSKNLCTALSRLDSKPAKKQKKEKKKYATFLVTLQHLYYANEALGLEYK